jgi:hypothetical protein
MAWVSADCGATWRHHPLNVRDVGYAPTVVKHGGRFFLMASGSPLYTSDSPLGPFAPLGRIQIPHVAGMPGSDPMLFPTKTAGFSFWVHHGRGFGRGTRSQSSDEQLPGLQN